MYSWFDGDGPAASADGRRLRTALSQFATGVCLVTTVGQDGKREGMTINSFASVSLQPPLVLWSIRDDARSGEVFLSSGRFVLSVLSEEQQALAMHFARPAPDKFDQYEAEFAPGVGACPTLRRALATFSCSTYSRHKEGDHIILIGKVEQFAYEPGAPLLTHGGKLGGIGEFANAPST